MVLIIHIVLNNIRFMWTCNKLKVLNIDLKGHITTREKDSATREKVKAGVTPHWLICRTLYITVTPFATKIHSTLISLKYQSLFYFIFYFYFFSVNDIMLCIKWKHNTTFHITFFPIKCACSEIFGKLIFFKVQVGSLFTPILSSKVKKF